MMAASDETLDEYWVAVTHSRHDGTRLFLPVGTVHPFTRQVREAARFDSEREAQSAIFWWQDRNSTGHSWLTLRVAVKWA